MIKQGNLMVASITEFASLLASKIDKDNVLAKPFPACDFCLLTKEELKYVREHNSDSDVLETVQSGAVGWYGIKSIDMGFGSPDLTVVADYYGGSYDTSLKTIRIWDSWDDAANNPEDIFDDADRLTNLVKQLLLENEDLNDLLDDYSDLSPSAIMLLVNILDKTTKNELNTYVLPVTWEVCGTVTVQAKSPKEAIVYFKENSDYMPLPCNAEYVDDSFMLSDDNEEELLSMIEELSKGHNSK
jgi:hypothetical protein